MHDRVEGAGSERDALGVEEQVGREVGELALVADRERRRRRQARDAAAARAADGREREVGDVVALVVDPQTFGELRSAKRDISKSARAHEGGEKESRNAPR